MKYDRYTVRPGEGLLWSVLFLLADLLLSYLFYDSFYAFLFGLPLMIPYFRFLKKRAVQKQKQELCAQFIDLITAAAARINAGISPENAFCACREEMEQLYGKGSFATRELKTLEGKLENGISLQEALLDFGRRSGVPMISEFSRVFSIAEGNGGRLGEVISASVHMLREKYETEAEIAVLISGKRLEQRIMCVIPIILVAFLRLEAASFMEILYHNPIGIFVMSLCLLLLLIAMILAGKIINIEV